MTDSQPLMIETAQQTDDDQQHTQQQHHTPTQIEHSELKVIFKYFAVIYLITYFIFWICYTLIYYTDSNRPLFIASFACLAISQFYFTFREFVKKKESLELFDLVTSILFLLFAGFFYCNIFLLISERAIYLYTLTGLTYAVLFVYVYFYQTTLQDSYSWFIVLIFPLIVQFIYTFFAAISILDIVLLQWLYSFLLLMIKELPSDANRTLGGNVAMACYLNGVVVQVFVAPIQLAMSPKTFQDIALQDHHEIHDNYIRKEAVTFAVYYLFMGLCVQFYNDGLDKIDYYYQSFAVLFWVSVGLCLICYPLLLLFHRKLSPDSLWILSVLFVAFYTFIVVGICSYFYIPPNLDLRLTMIQTIIGMIVGVSLGLQAYANIQGEQYNQKKAILYMMIIPLGITICQIYTFSKLDPIYILYCFIVLVIIGFYSLFIIVEIHLQMHNNLIKLKDSEYQLGAIMLYNPVQKMLIRFFLLILKLFQED